MGLFGSMSKLKRDPVQKGRPLLLNPDGSFSTEESITITDPRINGGAPTNIPSIWGGRRYDEENAVLQALQSKLQFDAYKNIDEAVWAARMRSEMLGRVRGNEAEKLRRGLLAK